MVMLYRDNYYYNYNYYYESNFQENPSFFSKVYKTYIIKGDGSETIDATVEAPNSNIMDESKFAIVKNVLYLFGINWRRQIAFLDGCSFSYLSVELIMDPDDGSAALTLQSGNEGFNLRI